MNPFLTAALAIALLGFSMIIEAGQLRPPTNDTELVYWLRNMATHRYTLEEMAAVVGQTTNDTARLIKSKAIEPFRSAGQLLVLPYPGGRHPRIGFLEGAIDPQRETKISIFTPWDPTAYVVVDVPEAVFSNLGLLYLAHTHVATVWTKQGIALPQLEWRRKSDGSLESERVLPNKVAFGAIVRPESNIVSMELWLRNGTQQTLTGLRVQNCVMLKEARTFSATTNANKILKPPFAATRSSDGKRWIITWWEPCQRTWANPPVPCMHSDPQFPDCPAGQSQRVRGWLSFYEGDTVEKEFDRLRSLITAH